jgi:hypothetical protein
MLAEEFCQFFFKPQAQKGAIRRSCTMSQCFMFKTNCFVLIRRRVVLCILSSLPNPFRTLLPLLLFKNKRQIPISSFRHIVIQHVPETKRERKAQDSNCFFEMKAEIMCGK